MLPDPRLDGYDAEILNVSSLIIDSGDLPYPSMPVPPYRLVENGAWRLASAFIPAAPGYFSGPRPLDWTTYLLVKDGITWMSIVPMEIESQLPHLAAARGTVVVCGLGLGLMAYAVSARQAVSRVVVVERDPEIIAMFRKFAAFDAWAQRGKVDIVCADAREFRLDGVDFLYADIWPNYRMDTMVSDMAAIHRGIPAPLCGYWGQELDMVDFALDQGVAVEDFDHRHVEAFAEFYGLPLTGLEESRYPALCRLAARNPAIGQKRIPVTG